MIRVVIGDSDLFAREGVKQMLSKHEDIYIVEEAETFSETLQCLGKAQADVCIVEIAMAGHCGLQLLRALRQQFPNMPFLIVSYRTERDFALRCMRAGASGFVSKDCSDQQLAGAIRIAAARRPYISEAMSELIAESIIIRKGRGHQNLSDLDFEILCLLANGMSISMTARHCDTSVSAVRTRKNNIMDKLDLHSDADLVQYALQHQLIDYNPLSS